MLWHVQTLRREKDKVRVLKCIYIAVIRNDQHYCVLVVNQ